MYLGRRARPEKRLILMAKFNPSQAAAFADDVYAYTRQPNIQEAVAFLKMQYGDNYVLPDTFTLKAKTGGPAYLKTRTAFGMFLLGKGKYQGHAVICIRGTQYLADWLTNLNISVSSSAVGEPVHDGFNQAFQSMKEQLEQLIPLIRQNRVHTVHCIGHSLGGALATICADWLSSSKGIKPYLYTFGSPRVGLYTFSSQCTRRLGTERIFRTYHRTDIVPCIPIWPFIHTPCEGTDYFLPSPGMIPWATYHSMEKYIESVDNKSWGVIASIRDENRDENSVKRWLKEETPLSFTISSIEWVSKALEYVIEKCLNGVSFAISKGASASLTLMDRLAYILNKGIDLSEQVSTWVLHLMRRIMQLLGYGTEIEMADLTFMFIRNLLIKLQNRVNEFAKKALSNTLVGGRAI